MRTLVASLLSSTLLSTVLSSDRLIMAQTLWRHGARTPRGTYPTDPYQQSFWGVPFGELTTTGMRQQFDLGKRLRQRYIEQTGLLQKKYNRFETYVRSADTPRCLQSAMANMAGFYWGSPTFPSDVNGWPPTWTPIPVHTKPEENDHEMEVDVNCPRHDQLISARENQRGFQDFLASKGPLFETIKAHAGGNFNVSFYTINEIYNILKVQRDGFNLTMPSWVTDDVYNSLKETNDKAEDYIDGHAGFGLPDDSELLRLRGGFLLKEMVKNLDDVVTNATTIKYFAYSGHDTTLRALLMCLGVKNAIIGPGNPNYASAIALELWKRKEHYYVKLLFAPDSQSDPVDYTSFLPMKCSDGFCPLSLFLKHANVYTPKTLKECDKR